MTELAVNLTVCGDDMRALDLDIHELLELDPEHGTIRFAGERAILLDAGAMGLLRKQLTETFGPFAARAIFTRFGYAHGWRMAEAMDKEFTWDSREDWQAAGGRIHVLQGLLKLLPGRGPLSPEGSRVVASYEAEQHLLHLGRSEAPVCWTLTGFASGYLSRTEGQDIYVLEKRCVGRGDAACHFLARTEAAWGEALAPHRPYFAWDRPEVTLRKAAAAIERAEARLRRAHGGAARGDADADNTGGLVARSEAMRRVLELARRAARVDSTVLVTGESGVGKERVTRLVHESSARAGAPLLAVNCAAIPEALLESELFGHARGAFTGAAQDRIGLFEAAGRGTLFLDEVGELPLTVQAKLLRALQERVVRRVGENRDRPVDVRIVAATNQDLPRDVAEGRFRRDLYYRLHVVELKVPALRERREDILPLARGLLERACAQVGRPALRLGRAAADPLLRYRWPGNVRELENAMERAAALALGARVEVEDLPEEVRRADAAGPGSAARTLAAAEQAHIIAVLAEHGGNQTAAAKALEIGVSTLYRKLKAYNARRIR